MKPTAEQAELVLSYCYSVAAGKRTIAEAFKLARRDRGLRRLPDKQLRAGIEYFSEELKGANNP